MSKESIWFYFKRNSSLSDEAIAGIMGNMEAESNCESCRVQADFTADRRVSKEYARKVNSGEISMSAFSTDSRGFGLCQWTFHSRKASMLNSCRSQGKGIEDEQAQLAFFLAEMQNDFTGVWNQLLNAHDIGFAADLVCRYYEMPAVNNVAARAEYGKEIYKQFHGKGETYPPVNPPEYTDSRIIELLEQILSILKGEWKG